MLAAVVGLGAGIVGCQADPVPDVPPLHPQIDDLPESRVTIEGTGDVEVVVDVKVAATPDQRRRGLMEVEDLPGGTGMLFLFDRERTGGFWMYNTPVPLDIAFIGADDTIVDIVAMDPCGSSDPDGCPTYPPAEPYVAALEVPQAWFAWQGVEPGARLTWTEPAPPPA
jgi:uncharacterized protein